MTGTVWVIYLCTSLDVSTSFLKAFIIESTLWMNWFLRRMREPQEHLDFSTDYSNSTCNKSKGLYMLHFFEMIDMCVTKFEHYIETIVLKTISQWSNISLRNFDKDIASCQDNIWERYLKLDESLELKLSFFHSPYRVNDGFTVHKCLEVFRIRRRRWERPSLWLSAFYSLFWPQKLDHALMSGLLVFCYASNISVLNHDRGYVD